MQISRFRNFNPELCADRLDYAFGDSIIMESCLFKDIQELMRAFAAMNKNGFF